MAAALVLKHTQFQPSFLRSVRLRRVFTSLGQRHSVMRLSDRHHCSQRIVTQRDLVSSLAIGTRGGNHCCWEQKFC